MKAADVVDYPRMRDALLAAPSAERERVCKEFEAAFCAKHGLSQRPTFFALLEVHASGGLREPANEAELRGFLEKACRPPPQNIAYVPPNPVAQLERCMENVAEVHTSQRLLADRQEMEKDPRCVFTRMYQRVTEQIAHDAAITGLANPWLEVRCVQKFHMYYEAATNADDAYRRDPSAPKPEAHWKNAFDSIREADAADRRDPLLGPQWLLDTLMPRSRRPNGEASRAGASGAVTRAVLPTLRCRREALPSSSTPTSRRSTCPPSRRSSAVTTTSTGTRTRRRSAIPISIGSSAG